MIKLNELEERELWLTHRRKAIGSSDASAILGYGYSGLCATTVWQSKVHGAEVSVDDDTQALMDEGKRCEEYVVKHFGKLHPEMTVREGSPHEIRTCKDYSYLSATLDAEITDADGNNMPLEAKWIVNHPQDWADDNCPIKFQIQLHHQMIVTGATRGVVAAFICGRWVERWFDRDDDTVKWMLDKYHDFWASVLTKTPPIDESPAAFGAARPHAESGVAKIVGGQLTVAVKSLLDLSGKIATMESGANKLKSVIARDCGDCEYLILQDQTVVKLSRNTIKQVKSLPRGVKVL